MRGVPVAKDVDAYIAREPAEVQKVLKNLRATITAAAPEATESIGYGMPYYKQDGSLIAFGAFKDHCSLFGMGSSMQIKFKDELKGYKTSKGTIQFTIDKPIPKALVKKMVKMRLAENAERKAARGK